MQEGRETRLCEVHVLRRYARRKESGFYASKCPPTDTARSLHLAGSGWSSWSVVVVPQSRVSDMRYARRKGSGLPTSESVHALTQHVHCASLGQAGAAGEL